MKNVIVAAVILVLSYQASAQEEKENSTAKKEKTGAAIAILTEEKAASTDVISPTTPTTSKNIETQNKKPKKLPLSPKSKKIVAVEKKETETTLKSEDKHEAKVKARFVLVLEKRLKIDAEGN